MAGNQGRRLDKVEQQGLTPLQAVLVWLDEAHRQPSLMTYVRSLLGKPPSAFPLVFLPEQVEQATREALKGKDRGEIDRRVYRAKQDVAFLFFLHEAMNVRAAEREEVLLRRAVQLNNEVVELLRQEMVSCQMAALRRKVYEEPYPLDPETVAASRAAQRHAVETWDILAEAGTLEGWASAYFAERGAKHLPLGSYGYQSEAGEVAEDEDEAWSPLRRPSHDELRSLLGSEAALEDFLTGRDYYYGISGVRDVEFETLVQKVESALRALVASGKVREGAMVTLETVPHPFLREAPLVEGEWLDRTVVELAEWGALVREKGFRVVPSYDDHPLAWDRVVPVEPERVAALWDEARRRVAKLPGKRREIEGREYVSFASYASWRGRKAKGNLLAQVKKGLDLSSWNAWVAAQSKRGPARLAGVAVAPLPCWSERALIEECGDVEQAVKRLAGREKAIADLERWTLSAFGEGEDGDPLAGFWARVLLGDDRSFREKVLGWRAEAEGLWADACELEGAARAIGERYLGGREVLFPDLAESLGTVKELVEFSVGTYNRVLAPKLAWRRRTLRDRANHVATGEPRSERIDLVGLREVLGPRVAAATTYVVDQAKAETLRLCNENDAASAVMEKHIT